jgi:anthranilate phosphoribosyltransferase
VALENGAVRRFTVTPDDAGLERSTIDRLRGGDPQHNASALRRVLEGEKSPYRDIAVLNAAASLVVAEKAGNIKEGATIAQKALDSGAARATLEKLVISTNKA